MIKILIWKQCEEMLMLVLQSYEQASGFSVLTADELYYINGGSFSWSGLGSAVAVGAGTGAMTGIGVVTGAIAGWVGGFITGGFGW